MFRFPVSHTLVMPRSSAAVATAAAMDTHCRFSSHWTQPSLQQSHAAARRTVTRGLGDVNEDRVARWCRRLWDITRRSADAVQPTHLLPRPNPLHEAQLKVMDETAATAARQAETRTAATTAATISAPTPVAAAVDEAVSPAATSTVTCDSMDVDALLARLQHAIRGDGGRIPGAIVEDVWAVFDLLVPPSTQDDVSAANITPEMEENFFAFVSTLNELDFDLQAVVQASKDLEVKLGVYLGQLRQLEDKEKQLAAVRLTRCATDRANEASEFTERLMKAKTEVMRCCFQARNVGAPLYYTWLRHTASLSDGLRRLMHFRKLAHHFETLCKRRIKEFSTQLTPAKSDLTAEAKDNLVRQQFKWRSRQMELGLIDNALSLLFHDFFAKEYLVMEELTWFSTPPSLLDQIMRAEGVHPFVNGIDDMRYRLQPTHHRHLFAFLHPAVVEEPLIAVQVALTHGIACSVDRILGRATPLADPANTTKAAELFRQLRAAETSHTAGETAAEIADGNVNTAIFYSINSAQSALRGMDMGNRLIKRVVKEIEGNINASRQGCNLMPILTFSTLSPIPLYVKWLAAEVAALATKAMRGTDATTAAAASTGIFGAKLTQAEEEQQYLAPLREAVAGYILRHPTVLTEEARAVAASAAAVGPKGDGHPSKVAEDPAAANVAALRYLLRLFQTSPTDTPAATAGNGVAAAAAAAGQWWNDHAFTGALEGPLLRSIAVYLCNVKRHGSARIHDPVGNFHVSNGATVYRLNYLGNTTAQGSRESACVMVNYWYDLPTVSSNLTEYEASQHVALGEPIEALLGAEAQ
ncbi:putative mitochondrial malonyl-coa decarboxylase-like protein [Leptomonas pyrrhocoris]|uniref:Putative mitochondrial malonyl-coa decarboxylase-like protein n=1 Tax=Leptomonas pyrrhocoris TaxID=157538 RepID=A0A0M9FR10_LEPPY|nr:putative mitochondrial malonyl-coa decarboxylase-like protein [Leptomonas pyrrhocoris]KPA74295.1 putative mitochondrial malonyl-coa decarboxylase-like protein [Leptomonas pyrrhocoris]|eukprot:XP_015652734.1 putative mitochondrial malonyl-coa decarboxylase-like protein [Leptomonas pyrrhocoris]